MPFKEAFLKTKEEFRSRHFWKSVRCEFIGSLFYTLFGCGSCLLWNGNNNGVFGVIKISLGFGLSEAVLVQTLGPVSGGQFNPVITLAMLCTRYISTIRALLYFVVQFVGSLVGAAILYGITPSSLRAGSEVPRLQHDIEKGQAFGFEFLATFLLVLAYFSGLECKKDVIMPNALLCGTAFTLSHLFAFDATGASMNPARSLGPAIMYNSWDTHWIYWIGPVLGGILGAFTFEYTKDCSKNLEGFRSSSSEQRVYNLQRKEDAASTNSITTELACDQEGTTEELQI